MVAGERQLKNGWTGWLVGPLLGLSLPRRCPGHQWLLDELGQLLQTMIVPPPSSHQVAGTITAA